MDKKDIITKQMLGELGDKADSREVLFAKTDVKPNLREKLYPVGTMFVVVDRPDNTYWLVKTVLDDMTFTVDNAKVYTPEAWFETDIYRKQMYLLYCLAVRFHRAWIPKTTVPGILDDTLAVWRENGFIDEKVVDREKCFRMTTIALATAVVVFADTLPSIMGSAHVNEETGELYGYSFDIIEDESPVTDETSPVKTLADEENDSIIIHDFEEEVDAEKFDDGDLFYMRVSHDGTSLSSAGLDHEMSRWLLPQDCMRIAMFMLRAAQVGKPLYDATIKRRAEEVPVQDAEGEEDDGIPF